jgi:hypothetical protein
VENISPGRVSLRSLAGLEVLEAATICWTAGVRASKLGKVLADRTECPVDRGGRLIVEPDFSVPGYPEIRVVGDSCAYTHTADGKSLPGMAGPAVQMGGWVAKDILARLKGEEVPPFRWVDLGSMAVIGPWYAVADLRGWHVTGLMGWVLWALAHLAFIPDTENRIALFSKWMWGYSGPSWRSGNRKARPGATKPPQPEPSTGLHDRAMKTQVTTSRVLTGVFSPLDGSCFPPPALAHRGPLVCRSGALPCAALCVGHLPHPDAGQRGRGGRHLPVSAAGG